MAADQPQKTRLAEGLPQVIEGQVARKLKAQRRGDRSVWFGLGMLGMIGWTVAIPTFLGAAAGLWIDRHYPGPRSWTLALLVGGLVLGCAQAGHWMMRENKKIKEEGKDSHE